MLWIPVFSAVDASLFLKNVSSLLDLDGETRWKLLHWYRFWSCFWLHRWPARISSFLWTAVTSTTTTTVNPVESTPSIPSEPRLLCRYNTTLRHPGNQRAPVSVKVLVLKTTKDLLGSDACVCVCRCTVTWKHVEDGGRWVFELVSFGFSSELRSPGFPPSFLLRCSRAESMALWTSTDPGITIRPASVLLQRSSGSVRHEL